MMNMTSLQCFMKVAEHMSFSKAADALFVSQQSVSLHIKKLEEAYSVTLFERRPALRLTDAGKILLEAAHDLCQRQQQLYDQLAAAGSEHRGSIAIGLPPNRSAQFAAEFVPSFVNAYPYVSVSLIEKTSSMLPGALQQNEIDLALMLLAENDSLVNLALFEALPLDREDLYLVVSDALLERHFGTQVRECIEEFEQGVLLEDFAELPMFLRPLSSRSHQAIVEYLVQCGRTPFIRIQTTTTSALIPLCAAGHGIFFCPPRMLRHLQLSYNQHFDSLHAFPIRNFGSARYLTLVYHKRKYLTKPILDSISIICENYEVASNVRN